MNSEKLVGIEREREIYASCKSETPLDNATFEAAFIGDNGKFIPSEGETWDFKKDWPFSRSDDYFYSLCKHICGFANNSGGYLIFNVEDETRESAISKIAFNSDSFAQGFFQILKSPVPIGNIQFHEFSLSSGARHPAIIVPPKQVQQSPWRIEVPNNPRLSGFNIFYRKGHETKILSESDYSNIFLGSSREPDTESARQVDVQIPPMPTTVKKFVGRVRTLTELFDWINDPDTPVKYLWGKGGSGKSTIAWHLCRLFKDRGSSPVFGHDLQFETVCFLTAKSTQFDPKSQASQTTSSTDFFDRRTLLLSILDSCNYTSDTESLNLFSLEEAEVAIRELFQSSSLLIVIDDIDTLTTAGEDVGLAKLITLATRSPQVKILFTQRNPPQIALDAALEVPGLQDIELLKFCSVCAEQFGVPVPSADLAFNELSKASENRPLAIETLIALRRSTDSYTKAIDLFRREKGENLREYIFRREWDAISNESRGRELLCALALLNRQASFEDLEIILQTGDDATSDAIATVREMFLSLAPDKTSSFELATLTRAFVLKTSPTMDYFQTIRERVATFRKDSEFIKPAVLALQHKIESKAPSKRWYLHKESPEQILAARRIVDDARHDPNISEDVGYRQYRAYVYSLGEQPGIEQIMDDIRYVVGMKKRIKEELLLPILVALDDESTFSHGEELFEIVENDDGYSSNAKQHIRKEHAKNLRFHSRQLLDSAQEKAFEYCRKSLLLNMKAYRVAVSQSDADIQHLEKHCRTTLFWLLRVSGNKLNRYWLDTIEASLKSEARIPDPLTDPIVEAIQLTRFGTFPASEVKYIENSFRRVRKYAQESNWQSDTSRSSVLNSIDSALRQISEIPPRPRP